MNDVSPSGKGAVSIGRISYINVSPVYYGLDRALKPDWLTMVTEPPAMLNRMLETGEIVMSPISSAAYAKNHRSWIVMPDVSIASFGKVMSVLLASHVKLDGLNGKKIIFTEESATAANLVRLILAQKKVESVIETRRITTAKDLSGQADAVLVIGDAALTENWAESFEYVYDLGNLWNDMTGLPFVYAVWAIRRDFAEASPEIISRLKLLFSESKRQGDGHKGEIVMSASKKTGLSPDLCREYFEHLDCNFGSLHLKGLTAFFDGLFRYGLIPEKVTIDMA
jgi:chorismate dehydratase